ncbi:outer membrane beta-barrel protein [Steroidobacter flavus]|uniref:Outer membrane beta-barrel protein n=1 Tax=Steroidobacter flavus TaxID=1842136 RepID=A0ABV8SP48_9GAMM
MHKRVAVNGLALLGLLASTSVFAETHTGFYLGAGLGTTSIEDDDTGFDGDDTGFKLFLGYNVYPNFALEVTYFDGAKPEERVNNFAIQVAATGVNFSALGRLPLGDIFTAYGRVGFAKYDTDISLRLGNLRGSDSDSSTDLSYGIGGAFNVGAKIEVRGEYEVVDVSGGDFNVLSVSGLYKF